MTPPAGVIQAIAGEAPQVTSPPQTLRPAQTQQNQVHSIQSLYQ